MLPGRNTIVAILVLAPTAAGCGNTSRDRDIDSGQPDRACPSGVALIGVHDGFAAIVCGCAGQAGGTIVQTPNEVTCAVSTGTTLIFQFHGRNLRHQILPVGEPSLGASGVFDPKEPFTVRSHSVVLSQPGTYRFQDALSPIAGAITAQ